MSDTTFAIPKDPDGKNVVERKILIPPSAGGVTITNDTETAITPAPSKWTYLQRVEAVCTVASATVVEHFALRANAGGPTIYKIAFGKAPAIGDRIVVEFPTPLRSGDAGAFVPATPDTGETFTIQASESTPGTWFFTVNGFEANFRALF